MDYYEILGVSETATDKEIKAAYRKLATEYHPDKNNDPDAEIKIKNINEAYSILKDKNKRVEFDNKHKNVFSGFGNMNVDISDIFNKTNLYNTKKKTNLKKTFDKKNEIVLDITFEESILGVTQKNIVFNYKKECSSCNGHGGIFLACESCNGIGTKKKNDGFISINTTCIHCNGTGKQKALSCKVCNDLGFVEKSEEININIPEGLNQKTKLFVRNKGNIINGARGDLYISINIIPHEAYSREGNNIIFNYFINVLEILLENTISVKTIRGTKNIALNPDIIKEPIIYSGMGTKTINGNTYGDFLIFITPYIPKLTVEEKKIIEKILK